MRNSTSCDICFPDSLKMDPTKAPDISSLSGSFWILISCLMSIPGLVLCPVLGLAIMKKEKLQSTANMLIVVMAVTDFLNSLLGTVMFGITWTQGHYPRQKWAGHLQGTLYPSLAMTTFYILGEKAAARVLARGAR